MHQCPKCNAPIAEGGTFCTNCGNRLNAAPAATGFFNAAGSLDDSPSPVVPQPAPAPAPRPAPAPAPVSRPAPAPADAPPPELFQPNPVKKPSRRISAGKELKLLLRQGMLILVGDRRNLLFSLLFPFIAAFFTVWVAGEDMFVTYEATKSACFILVCAAIWCGLFNSIQSLVKERDNIKRDYVSGALRIECYMGSRAIIQMALCALQSLVLTISIPAIGWVYGNSVPSFGLLGLPAIIEFYVSLFFVMYASDALGLLISSLVKKEALASTLAPYILIAQLLFSGVLFKLEGGAKALSSIMISRWGMEALGSICELNSQSTKVYTELVKEDAAHIAECPVVKQGADYCECANGIIESLKTAAEEDMFEATSGHLLLVFFIMLGFVVVSLVAADLLLHRVKKDGRD